ncbi:MAG TPA: pirin family protein [Gammaproteobacteria bacterium]|nr:pirin family protein [Gammaproteobacteria bacterium]
MEPGKASSSPRGVVKTVRGRPTSDGAGVRLNRVMGTPQLPDLDPFLMLDEFRSDDAGDYIAGFPNHPHRGFETVTYMLAGRMRHGDNQGNSGLLTAGSVQWMTAGRGIVHSEMPEQEDGLMWGFQLWVNLPAKDKMTAPRYQDIGPESIPVVEVADGVRVKVVAGEVNGARGPVSAVATEPVYLDIELQPGAEYVADLAPGHNAFAYVYAGTADIGSRAERIASRELAVLEQGGDSVYLAAAGNEPARLLLVAGRPLGEPVARYGPFVMNTTEQLHAAVADFQAGRL